MNLQDRCWTTRTHGMPYIGMMTRRHSKKQKEAPQHLNSTLSANSIANTSLADNGHPFETRIRKEYVSYSRTIAGDTAVVLKMAVLVLSLASLHLACRVTNAAEILAGLNPINRACGPSIALSAFLPAKNTPPSPHARIPRSQVGKQGLTLNLARLTWNKSRFYTVTCDAISTERTWRKKPALSTAPAHAVAIATS